MSYLAQVTSSTVPTGFRAILAGNEKIGKTTLACSAPRPLLIPLEMGYGGVNVNKTPMMTTLYDVMQFLEEVHSTVHAGLFPYQTLVFDSGTALERLIHEATIAGDKAAKSDTTMESALGGYGKAYTFANSLFDQFLKKLDILCSNYAINIIITCHVFAAKMVDPTSGEYDTWDLLLHSPKNQKTYGKREMITQWADLVGFIHEPRTNNGN